MITSSLLMMTNTYQGNSAYVIIRNTLLFQRFHFCEFSNGRNFCKFLCDRFPGKKERKQKKKNFEENYFQKRKNQKCEGIIGYFSIWSFFYTKKKWKKLGKVSIFGHFLSLLGFPSRIRMVSVSVASVCWVGRRRTSKKILKKLLNKEMHTKIT